MTQDTAMLTARIPVATVETLTATAARRGVSRSEAIRESLALWLKAEAA